MNLSCTGEKDIYESDGEGKENFPTGKIVMEEIRILCWEWRHELLKRDQADQQTPHKYLIIF
jgi:hypothetical protein